MEQVLQELLKTTKYQLFHYPEFTKKQDIKYLIKRVLRPANTPKRDFFFWTHAILTQSLEEAKDLESLKKYFDLWIEKGQNIYNIDNVMNGYSLLYVYEQTKEEKYKQAADKLFEYLLQYKKEMEDTIPYRKHHPNHIYADGLGMIVPFLCRYGKIFGKEEAIELGVSLIKEFMEQGMDENSGLPYHGYDWKTKVKYGIIGWGRAVGWLLLAMADSYEYLDEKEKEWLQGVYGKLLVDSINCLREDGYFSWQLEAKEGPKDTGATAMIGYALQKALNLGIVQAKEEVIIKSRYRTLNKTKITFENSAKVMEQAILLSVKQGKIMDCSGECEGFSQYPQVYGAYPWSLGPGVRFLMLRKEG